MNPTLLVFFLYYDCTRTFRYSTLKSSSVSVTVYLHNQTDINVFHVVRQDGVARHDKKIGSILIFVA
jgi:hypothetical protein